MRHLLGYRKLNRTSEHRKALFKNMLNSLIKYEQITTTLPKAKELKPKIDKVITLGKKNSLQSKKNLFDQLQSKDSVEKLSKILSQRYEKRKGGYCRVIIVKQKNIFNDKINLTNLQKHKLINKRHTKLKLLGSGDLKQKFDIEVNSISKSAKEKIEKLGGKVTLIK